MTAATDRANPGAGGSMMILISPSEADLSEKHTLAPFRGFQPEEVMPRLSFSPQRNKGCDRAKTSVPEKCTRGTVRAIFGVDSLEHGINSSSCCIVISPLVNTFILDTINLSTKVQKGLEFSYLVD
jgi:hypothetical protein